MDRSILMHAALRCPEDTFSTNIWPIEVNNAVCICNKTPDIQSGIYTI